MGLLVLHAPVIIAFQGETVKYFRLPSETLVPSDHDPHLSRALAVLLLASITDS